MTVLADNSTRLSSPEKPVGAADRVQTSSGDDTLTDDLLVQWDRLLAKSTEPCPLFHSFQWFDHVRKTQPDTRPYILAARDRDGWLSGIIPVIREKVSLEFSVKSAVLLRATLDAMQVLGSVPLYDGDATTCDELFAAFEQQLGECDAVSMSMVPTNSEFWRFVNRSPRIRAKFVLYLPDGVERTRLIAIDEGFDAYLAKFSAKTRSELRRQVRRLGDREGTIRLQRFEYVDDVEPFLAAATQVVRNSWQFFSVKDVMADNHYWRSKLIDLARRHLLRSYVLFCGERPCAVELGYQFRDVFYGVQTHFDQGLAKLSPGSVLLYLYLQDLTTYKPVKLLTFGYADAPYKAFFGNRYSDDALVLLVRKRVLSRIKVTSHWAFRSFIRFIKRRVRPQLPASS